MNFKLSYFKSAVFAHNQVRLISSRKRKNHYDSLGITSGSTQGEVKTAYYKLSMMYHPDKAQNSIESSQKFRDITEAYEVLGNVKTRKLYDKGLYFGGSTPATEDPVERFHRSRETRSRPPAPSGRTPIYDFDEWSKRHYGATFQRQMEHKRRLNFRRVAKEQEIVDIKTERVLIIMGVLFFVCMYIFQGDKTYDTVTYFGTKRVPKNDED